MVQVARPNLQAAYVVPRNEPEQYSGWSKWVLYDSLFELGGNSLAGYRPVQCRVGCADSRGESVRKLDHQRTVQVGEPANGRHRSGRAR